MATRKNGKEAQAQTEVVETPVETVEVSEETVTETPVETVEVSEVVETVEVSDAANETALTSVQWSSIKPELDDLNVDGLKEVIDYCQDRIDELQKEEVEALEAQMRAIQDKLLAMKGFRGKSVSAADKSASANGEKRSRTDKVVINPENPNEVYRFGKMPAWLTALMEKTGKQVWELRVDMPEYRSPLSQVTW